MKTKFFFVMSVAATMLLASCGGNNPTPAESSKPADTSTPSETSQVTPRVVSITCDLESNELIVGETLKLRPTVTVEGGASKIVSYKSSDTDIATVTDGGVVEGKNVGKVTITITSAADENVKCEVKLEIVAATVDAIGSLTDGQSAVVVGKVVAVNTRSYVIADETGAVMVYLNAKPEQQIGEVYKVSGTVAASQYSAGLVQFDSSAVAEAVEEEVNVPEKVALTPEIANGWLAKYTAATNKEGQYFANSEMKHYYWETVAAKDGNYDIHKIAGSDVVIEPVYADNKVYKFDEGKKYNVEGYFAGYRVPSSGNGYAQYVITAFEEVQAEAGEVTISGPKEVTVGESIELQGNVEGVDGIVEWSLKEGSAEFASIVANGNKVTVTGEKAGEAVVVATYGEKSAEWKVKVLVPFVEKSLKDAKVGDRIIVDGVVVRQSFNGFVIADATGFSYVYTKDFKDAAGKAIPLPEVGAHISLKATVQADNGAFRLIPSAMDVAEGAAPVAKAAVAMTSEKGLQLLAAVKQAKTDKTVVDGIVETAYSFENVAVKRGGNYIYWDLGEAHFENKNTANADLALVEDGKTAKLNIEAIPYGFYTDSKASIDYLTMVITKIEIVTEPESSEETSQVVPTSEETSQEAPVSQESSEAEPVSEQSSEVAPVSEQSSEEEPVSSPVTFVAGTNKGAYTDGQNDQVYVKPITLSSVASPLGRTDNYRIYKNQSVTIAIDEGYGVITKIEFTCTAAGDAQYGPGSFEAQDGYTYEDKVGTWVGSARSVTFVAKTNQVRATQIVVTFAK